MYENLVDVPRVRYETAQLWNSLANNIDAIEGGSKVSHIPLNILKSIPYP